MVVECDDDVISPDDIEKIKQTVKLLSKKIVIDKSYVSFPENKHEKTFIVESAWKKLCKMVIKSHFSSRSSTDDTATILEYYKQLINFYLYQCLDDLGYDIEGIYIEMAERSKFMSEIEPDTIHAWKDYPGKWQTWKDI